MWMHVANTQGSHVCMCMYVYVCMYSSSFVGSLRKRKNFMCMYVYVCICMHVCMYVCMYVCMDRYERGRILCVCVYMYVYVCMHACMYACVCMYVHA
jgi:hypothetical protein